MKPVNPTIIQFNISETDLPAFLAYLGLGTLCAIQSKSVSAEIGIWTLARPKFWEPMKDQKYIPQELIKLFQTTDELGAIEKLLPEQFKEKVGELIKRLQVELEKMNTQTWSADWSVQSARTNIHGATTRKRRYPKYKRPAKRQRS